jgi:hypothetical protein
MSASIPMLNRVPGIGIELSSSQARRSSRSPTLCLSLIFAFQPAPDRPQLPQHAAADEEHRGDQHQHEAFDLVRHAALGQKDGEAEGADERRAGEHRDGDGEACAQEAPAHLQLGCTVQVPPADWPAEQTARCPLRHCTVHTGQALEAGEVQLGPGGGTDGRIGRAPPLSRAQDMSSNATRHTASSLARRGMIPSLP